MFSRSICNNLLSACLILSPLSVFAASIASDDISVTTPTGVPLSSSLAETSAEGTNSISVTYTVTATPTVGPSGVSFGLTEPTPLGLATSDLIRATADGNSVTISLTSDTNTTSLFPTDLNLREDGTSPGFPLDANGFINITLIVESGFQVPTGSLGVILIRSDQDGGTSVPEPATLALLSVAFAGIAMARRRNLH